MTGQVQDELWQPSLDDVLGGSPTKSGHASQKTASGLSNTPGTSASSSAESSPRKWREWDAGKADKTLWEIQAASELPTASAKNFPVLLDTHREVTIRNGARVKAVKASTVNSKGSTPICRPPSSRQPLRSVKSPAKMCNTKKPAADEKSQPGSNFKNLDSRAVVKIPPSKLKSPPTSPLQLDWVNLSTAPHPICLPSQTVSTSPTMVPCLHYFEAVDKDPFSKISLDLMVKKNPSDNIFSDLTIQNSITDEEDLISFD